MTDGEHAAGEDRAEWVWDDPRWAERDTSWAAGCRWLQAWWRHHMLELPVGTRSRDPDSRLVASMLPVGADEGANFLGDDVLSAVQGRVSEGDHSGIIQRDRLFRNLLSSQPACFNLFGPFVTDPAGLLGWVEALDAEAVAVDAVRFEWAPDRDRHFGGGSAFDAFVDYTTEQGGRRFVGVECKYAEDLSRSAMTVRDVYKEFTNAHEAWRQGAADRLDEPRLAQFWLNTLLAQSLVQREDAYESGTVVVVACQSDHAAHEATDAVRFELEDPDLWLRWTPYEHVLSHVSGHDRWVDEFRARYLDFTPVRHRLKPGDTRMSSR